MRKSVITILIGVMLSGVCGQAWAGVTATDVVCTGCVNDTDIAAAAVTNAKIADGAVTDAKIAGPISASKIEKPANVVVVAKSGGDYVSISAAMAAINPTVDNPYVVKVMPGSYYEAVTMKSYVHLQGSGRDVTKITIGENPWYVIDCENVVNVAISGFTIDGYGIYNYYASPTITGNRFTMSYTGIGGGEGIINNHSSPMINDNIFEFVSYSYPGAYGVHNDSYSSPTISNNLFIGSGASGGTGVLGGTPKITNNIISGWGYSGVDAGNVISDNLIEGNGTGVRCAGGVVKNNVIRNNTSMGINNSSPASIIGNTITGNGGYGVNVSSSSIMTNNRITSNALDIILGGPAANISFNIYDTFSGTGAVGNYNLKSDGTSAPLQ